MEIRVFLWASGSTMTDARICDAVMRTPNLECWAGRRYTERRSAHRVGERTPPILYILSQAPRFCAHRGPAGIWVYIYTELSGWSPTPHRGKPQPPMERTLFHNECSAGYSRPCAPCLSGPRRLAEEKPVPTFRTGSLSYAASTGASGNL